MPDGPVRRGAGPGAGLTPLAPAAVAVLAITAALALYAALWRRVSGDALPWYLLTAALSVAYILLTILPPPAAYFTLCTVATGGTIPF